jgi:HEAT repeat protein
MLRFFFFYWVCFLLVFGQEEYYNSVESRVMDGLKDENWQVRKDAANILGQIRSKKAVDEMNERIFKEENHEVMAEYCHALGLIGEIRAEDPLVTIITSKLKISNELADIGLKRLSKKEKEAQEAKLQENQEKFQKVYREAIWSLGRIQSKKAVKAICTWAITAPTEEVRQTAVNALIEIGDPEAIYFLSQAVAKPINRELDPLEQKIPNARF